MGLLWTVLLNGGLGVAAYVVARDGFRQPPGWPRVLAAAVLAWAWLTVGMERLGSFGLLARGPLLGWVGLGLGVAIACRLVGRRLAHVEDRGIPSQPPGGGWGWDGATAVGLVLWTALTAGVPSCLLPVKVVSDGPIYHLYFAARWWKEGAIRLIATPFGENAATYFPAVGDLWFAWLMAGWGGDLLAKVGQGPFWLLAGMTTYALARRLGAGRPASLVATCWFLTATPLLLFSFEPNVDTLFVAGYLLAAYFFVRQGLGDDGLPALVLGALAAGCALGTKAVGVVFVPPLLGAALISAWGGGLSGATGCTQPVSRQRPKARVPNTEPVAPSARPKVAGLLILLLVPLVVAGFWYARNAALTGNPLYPLHLTVNGRVILAGWYGREVMRLSPYYVPVSEIGALGDILLAVLDPRLAPVWLLAVLGAWSWGKKGSASVERAVWLAAGFALVNVAIYWLAIPYRTQQRFMLQALGLAAVPLARLFDRGRVVRAAGLGLLAAHLLTPQSWPFVAAGRQPPWDLDPRIPNVVPGLISLPTDLTQIRAVGSNPQALTSLCLTIGIGLASLAVAFSWSRLAVSTGALPRARSWLRTSLATLVLFSGTAAAVFPWSADPRRLFFPAFPDYARGWVELDMRSGPTGARVAYAGNNLPYYLLGVGLRNEVRYVNVDAHPGWLLHDYHRAAGLAGSRPATWPHPRPGWDRVHPDYDAWLANLREAGIQLLVVTRANPDEGPHNVADREGFPVEKVWADAHPDVFPPLYGAAEGDLQFRLYRVRPEPSNEPG